MSQQNNRRPTLQATISGEIRANVRSKISLLQAVRSMAQDRGIGGSTFGPAGAIWVDPRPTSNQLLSTGSPEVPSIVSPIGPRIQQAILTPVRGGLLCYCEPGGSREGGESSDDSKKNGEGEEGEGKGHTEQGGGETEVKQKCGPDITDWLVEEINRNFEYWQKLIDTQVQGEPTGDPDIPTNPPRHAREKSWEADTIFTFKTWAAAVPYKYLDFNLPPCPTDCPRSVTLCDFCMDVSDIGNIVYGLLADKMAGINLGVQAAVWATTAGTGTGGTDRKEDMAGILAGINMHASKKKAPYTRDDLCAALNGSSKWQREHLNQDLTNLEGLATAYKFGKDILKKAKELMEQVDVPKDTLKKPCPICDLKIPPDDGHSDFSVFKDVVDARKASIADYWKKTSSSIKGKGIDRSKLDKRMEGK